MNKRTGTLHAVQQTLNLMTSLTETLKQNLLRLDDLTNNAIAQPSNHLHNTDNGGQAVDEELRGVQIARLDMDIVIAGKASHNRGCEAEKQCSNHNVTVQ